MALKAGKSVGGGAFLDWKELTAYGQRPRVAVFRIKEFCAPEPSNYGAPRVPVIVDVLLCDGDEAGEVHGPEKMIGAPTAPLRGVKNPTRDAPEVLPPANSVGDELVFRVSFVERKGSNPFLALDEPSQAEIKLAEQIYAQYAWQGKPTGEAPLAATGTEGAPAAAPASAPQPAAADAAKRMPWD